MSGVRVSAEDVVEGVLAEWTIGSGYYETSAASDAAKMATAVVGALTKAGLLSSRIARPLGYETATANDVWAQERINAPWSIKAREGGMYSLHDDDGAGRATVSCEADAIFLAALVLDDARQRNPGRLPERLR